MRRNAYFCEKCGITKLSGKKPRYCKLCKWWTRWRRILTDKDLPLER